MTSAPSATRTEDPSSVVCFRQILFLAQLLRYLFDRQLAEDGLSTAQAMALTVAGRPDRKAPPSLTELADELASSHQNLAVLLRGLARRGFVSVEQDPADGRVRRVVVQPESDSYWRQRDTADFAFIDHLFSGLSEDEQRDLTKLLSRLQDGVLATYRSTRG